MTFKITPVGATTVLIASDTAQSFNIGSSQVRIVSDRNIHISVNGADATQDDFPIRADQAEIITGLGSDAALSAVKGDGETDGTIWVTRVSIQ